MIAISRKMSILDVVDNLYVIKKGKINENNHNLNIKTNSKKPIISSFKFDIYEKKKY